MKELIFIRHGETAMAGTFCGHSDPPLTPCGRAQVEELCHRLLHVGIDVVFSSDLKRAQATATGLAHQLGLPVTTTPLLREINFGSWEGLSWKHVQSLDPVFAQRWIQQFPSLTPPAAEPYTCFQKRILAAYSQVIHDEIHQCAAIVTHRGVLCFALEHLCNTPADQVWQATAGYCSCFRHSIHSGKCEVIL